MGTNCAFKTLCAATNFFLYLWQLLDIEYSFPLCFRRFLNSKKVLCISRFGDEKNFSADFQYWKLFWVAEYPILLTEGLKENCQRRCYFKESEKKFARNLKCERFFNSRVCLSLFHLTKIRDRMDREKYARHDSFLCLLFSPFIFFSSRTLGFVSALLVSFSTRFMHRHS